MCAIFFFTGSITHFSDLLFPSFEPGVVMLLLGKSSAELLFSSATVHEVKHSEAFSGRRFFLYRSIRFDSCLETISLPY